MVIDEVHRAPGLFQLLRVLIYVRNTGLVHPLLRLDDEDGVLGHPIAGAS